MKRGVKFRPVEVSSEIKDEPMREICGIPIHYSQYHAGIADARGFWWNKRIVAGPALLTFDHRTRKSILMHEAKHCMDWHMEKRILFIAVTLSPMLFLPWKILAVVAAIGVLSYIAQKYAERQETEADVFSVESGYGQELLAFVRKNGPQDKGFYPPFEQRCENIEAAIKDFIGS